MTAPERSVEQARLLELLRQSLIAQIKANDEQRRALERALEKIKRLEEKCKSR